MNYRLIFIIGITILMISGMSNRLAQGEEGPVEKGKEVYDQKKCDLCHMLDGTGGKLGGDLSDVGSKRDAEWLSKYMKDPKSVIPEAKMPPFKGTDDELQALVAYLMSLRKDN